MASKPFEPSNKSSGGKEPEDESRKAMEQSIYGAETALAGRKKRNIYIYIVIHIHGAPAFVSWNSSMPVVRLNTEWCISFISNPQE